MSAADDAAAPYYSARVTPHRGARPGAAEAPRGGRLARNTAIFSIPTGPARIAGLVREIVAVAATSARAAPSSAFTIAFQVPNLVRSLFADAALSAAFVPVFTELLEKGKRARGVPARLDAAAA